MLLKCAYHFHELIDLALAHIIFSILIRSMVLPRGGGAFAPNAPSWIRHYCVSVNAIPLGTLRRLKPVNTGSHKHVTETLKNAEENPRPSGDLIPATCSLDMRQRSHSNWDLRFSLHSTCNLIIDFSPAMKIPI